MSTPLRWHGLGDAEVRALWSFYGWDTAVYYTLCEIVMCEQSAMKTRVSALSTLNTYAESKLLPVPVGEHVAVFSCAALVAMAQAPKSHKWWWSRRKAKRVAKEMAGRLTACRSILVTLELFVPEPLPDAITRRDPEKLLS